MDYNKPLNFQDMSSPEPSYSTDQFDPSQPPNPSIEDMMHQLLQGQQSILLRIEKLEAEYLAEQNAHTQQTIYHI